MRLLRLHVSRKKSVSQETHALVPFKFVIKRAGEVTLLRPDAGSTPE